MTDEACDAVAVVAVDVIVARRLVLTRVRLALVDVRLAVDSFRI